MRIAYCLLVLDKVWLYAYHMEAQQTKLDYQSSTMTHMST